MIYTVTLNPAIDREIHINELSFNDVNRVEREKYIAGGKGINVSRILNFFNIENKAIIISGGNRGKRLEKLLKEDKIDYIPIAIEGEIRENISIISGKDKKEIRINEKGPELKSKDLEKLEKIIDMIEENSTVFFSGSSPEGLGNDIYYRLIEKLNKKKIKSILDADTENLRFGIDAKPFIIKPNKEEFERLNKKVYNNQLGLIKDLKEINVDIKILTNAEDNLYIISKNKIYEVETIKTGIRRTLGVGDCFLAVFYIYYDVYNDIIKAIKRAVAASYLYLENRLDKDEIEKLSKKVKVKNLEVKD